MHNRSLKERAMDDSVDNKNPGCEIRIFFEQKNFGDSFFKHKTSRSSRGLSFMSKRNKISKTRINNENKFQPFFLLKDFLVAFEKKKERAQREELTQAHAQPAGILFDLFWSM